MDDSPALCLKGCGFYGDPATNNLCSKCYHDYLKDNIINHFAQVVKHSEKDNNHAPPPPVVLSAEEATDQTDVAGADSKKKKRRSERCHTCNRKVGLLGFTCRCGGLFCGVHRYAQKHACSFDFKEFDRKNLAQNNHVCTGQKLHHKI